MGVPTQFSILQTLENTMQILYLLFQALQSRTESPQAFWSAGGYWERLWGTEIFTAVILRLTVLSFVTVNSQSNNRIF